jgi:hypothetical protein
MDLRVRGRGVEIEQGLDVAAHISLLCTHRRSRTNGQCKIRRRGLFCHELPGAFTLSAPANSEFLMTHVTYKIVEHDGGWAYTVDGVFSEPFPNRGAALAAARRVAAEQRVPGRTEVIEYETADGRWHSETAAGNDRPETEVEG